MDPSEETLTRYNDYRPMAEKIPFPQLSDQEAATHYERARDAAGRLRSGSVKERLTCINRLLDVILKRRETIVDRIVQETGKGCTDALVSEILGVLDHLKYLAKFATGILADRKAYTPITLMGKKSWVYFEPLGTVLIISPWNYPFYQAIVPLTSAFVPGNAVIYKPSEFTPMRGLVEEILGLAGFERDWVQVVYGNGTTGAKLIEQRPDKIFFTGSVRTGKKIAAQAAPLLIPVELELGGKDPMIIFEDADLKRAAAGALWGALTNTGQSCTSVEYIYVQESIYDAFKQLLLTGISTLTQSREAGPDVDIGAMTTDFQAEIVCEQLQDAAAKGARFLAGKIPEKISRMIGPAVLENVTREMKIYTEETFGPLLPLISFRDESEVVRRVNESEYGLSAGVWTADLKRADRVARALVTGNVSINNVMLTEGNPALPFGGTKQSGFGRYKGEFGLYSFSHIKSVIVDKNSSKIEANWFPYTARKYQLFSDLIESLFRGRRGFLKFLITGLKLEAYAGKAGKDRK